MDGQMNVTPTAHITLAKLTVAHSHHRAIRSQPYGMTTTGRNRHQIAPLMYVTLAVAIITRSHCRTVRF